MTARRLAMTVWVLSILLALATVGLLVVGAAHSTPADDFGLTGVGGAAFLIASLTFATIGAVVAARVPGNRIGGIFCGTGLLMDVGVLAFQYADYALFISDDTGADGRAAAVLQNLTLTPAFGLLALALLLFPDGRPVSRGWLPALAVAVTGSACVAVGYALRPGQLDEPFDTVINPFGTGSIATMESLAELGWLLMSLAVALAAVSLVVRRRRSNDSQRHQLAWIGLAAVVAGVIMVANFVSFMLEVPGVTDVRIVAVGLAFASFPVAAGVAILRYRLYDIDVVINRTLVYGSLTATLAATYLGTVLVLQLALRGVTQDSGLAVAASTLAVAALFRPARTRIQTTVDRRFYRHRYDAQRTLESFTARLRDQVDLTALDTDLRGVVTETMQPAHVSVWLRGGTR